jgi:transposase InsO family protein
MVFHPFALHFTGSSYRELNAQLFGDPLLSLDKWRELSIGLNADRIHTPLLAQVADRELMEATLNFVPLQDKWLKDRHLGIGWAPFGVPALVHVDNGKEFRSLALTRGCKRYGISLEYRPPGRPQFGGHIERYLVTLMRRIHGLPGTTFSNPTARGKYKSEAHATMTMAELERWIGHHPLSGYHWLATDGFVTLSVTPDFAAYRS